MMRISQASGERVPSPASISDEAKEDLPAEDASDDVELEADEGEGAREEVDAHA
jgi:hypothetical protein